MDTKIIAKRDALSSGFTITIADVIAGRLSVCPELTFIDHVDGGAVPVACRISEESAVQLMNDLWDAGIRPMVPKNSAKSPDNAEYKKILYALLGITE